MIPSISSEDSASSEEPLRIIRDSDCGAAEAMRDMLENVKMMAQDMVELINNMASSSSEMEGNEHFN